MQHPELVANRLFVVSVTLGIPTHGVRSRGRPAMTYVDNLRVDTGLNDAGEMAGGLMAYKVL